MLSRMKPSTELDIETELKTPSQCSSRFNDGRFSPGMIGWGVERTDFV